MNPYVPWTKRRKRSLRKHRHRLQPNYVFGSPRRMHLARRNHRCHAAMQVAINPADLILARRPISRHRMHVAIDQSRQQAGSSCVDNQPGSLAIDVLLPPNRGNLAVYGENCVRIQNRPRQISAQQ